MKVETKASAASGAIASKSAGLKHPVVWAALLLFLTLSALFWQSYDPRYVHFSNDGPLGGMLAERSNMPLLWEGHLPTLMFGLWDDLNWLGSEALPASPSITTTMRWLAWNHVAYSRFLPLASLLIVGICASFCLRKMRLTPLACILGGLAAGLNSDFVSTSCWGVASQIVGFGMMYLALGFLADEHPRHQWLRVILAGMAVGVGIMEAYDIGALFSVVVAAFIAYRALFINRVSLAKSVGPGSLRLVLVAGFAAYISAQSLTVLIGTQLQGVMGMQQDKDTKQKHWSEATQWSLPKAEILQVFIPGIFGYRMADGTGGNYWGTIGSSPLIPEAQKLVNDPNANPQTVAQMKGFLANESNWRFSGTGYYAGVTVLIIALWAVLQSFRRQDSPFSINQRRMIWFWAAVMVLCVPLAFGRYAPFYQFFYALPYGSAVRNPTKFMHVFNWALIIVFAYGVHGIFLAYMQKPVSRAPGMIGQFKTWRNQATAFERRWVTASFCAIGVALLGWLFYASAGDALKAYIVNVRIPPEIAASDVKFSVHAVGWFVLFLALSVALLAMILSGQFSGSRAWTGGILLSTLLAWDLGRAASYWPLYWDINYKYATNPIIDLLREKPNEYRVDTMPWGRTSHQLDYFHQEFEIEWHQQLFPYYNIRSLKMVMEPRVTLDKGRFLEALPPPPYNTPAIQLRTWELTGARYLLGNGGEQFINALNTQVDPVQKRFRMITFPDGRPANFNIVAKPGATNAALSLIDVTAMPDTNGELGVVEFTGALPRASLISNWQVNTDDDAVLKELPSPEFDPHKLVLVSNTNFPAPLATNANLSPGTVEMDPNYHSKRFGFSADVKTPAILLLTDRYNPKWRVEVDGKPAELLRCDFILRGVYLTPGKHTVIFRFVTPLTMLYISLSAIALGLVLLGWYAFTSGEQESVEQPAESESVTVSSKSPK